VRLFYHKFPATAGAHEVQRRKPQFSHSMFSETVKIFDFVFVS